MGIARLLPKGTIHGLADAHPQLTGLRQRLVKEYRLHPNRARKLIISLVEQAANDLGDAYLGQMAGRLRRIESIRQQIAGAIDHIVAEGRLPPELNHGALSNLFDDLQKEMGQLRSPKDFAQTHQPKTDFNVQRAPPDPGPLAPSGHSLEGVVSSPPPGHLRQAMTDLAEGKPEHARLFNDAMNKHGDELSLAVLAATETMQNKSLAHLKDVLGSDYPPKDFEKLSEAVRELGAARSRAAVGPGSPTARIRARHAADLPDELRGRLVNDNTVLGPLAEADPQGLHGLWDAWIAGGRKSDFRDYVYREMRSSARPAIAEFEAAHRLAAEHGVSFLKDPAAYDPAQPNLRRVNPREGGTDLVGMRPDGEIWYIDDKSHRLNAKQRAAGKTGINVSGVSAFEGRRLIANMRDDVADMDAALQRMIADGHTPDAKAVDAVNRIRKAADALDRETAGWTDADFEIPANRQKIAAILARPDHNIKLKVTSTMGDVTDVTSALKNLGIEVVPTLSPTSNRFRTHIQDNGAEVVPTISSTPGIGSQ